MSIFGGGAVEQKVAVKYLGCISDWTGYGEANRVFIKALVEGGVDVTIEKVTYTNVTAEYGLLHKLALDLEARPLVYDIKIVHVPSDNYLKHLEPTKYHIGHLFWETDSMSKPWVWNCNLMDEIWTGAYVHKENFLKAGVKVPIYVFPQPVETNILSQAPFTLDGHKGFLFYSIFQWIERKNPKVLLSAYWKEFQNEENVSLLLKVYGFDFGGEQRNKIRKDILDWKHELNLPFYPRVFLQLELLSSDDIWRLHNTGDCFVSAHRGEGWGRPQEEALVVGNPVISTNFGGIHEWLEDEKNAFLVKWNPGKVYNMEFAPWYENSQGWAEVDEEDLRKRMRFVFDNRDKAKAVGLKGQEFVKDRFSFKAVGELMKNRLIDIQKQIR